jgi:hypothetical protein
MMFVRWTDDDGTAQRGALLSWLPSGFTVAIVELGGEAIWVDKGRLILDGYVAA